VKLDTRRNILSLLLMGMEGCWLYALLFLVSGQVFEARVSVLWLLFIYPIAFVTTKLLQALPCPEVGKKAVSWFAWFLVMMLVVKFQLFSGLGWSDTTWLLALPRAVVQLVYTFRPELFILLSSVLLWWLGRRLACLRLDFAASVTEFQFGLVILLLALFVMSALGLDFSDHTFVIPVFVVLALLGMFVSRFGTRPGWLVQLWESHSLGLLVASLGLIVVLGLVVAVVLTPNLVHAIVVAVKWVWGLILWLMQFIADLLPAPSSAPPPPPVMPVPPGLLEPSEGSGAFTMPDVVRHSLRIGWSILASGIVLAFIWRVASDVFGWLRLRLGNKEGAEVEALQGAFGLDLSRFARYILDLLLRFKLFLVSKLRKRPAASELGSVRQVYRQLLRWAAAAGYPRGISQTPYEYLHTLSELMPQARADLDFVTEEYVGARYGPLLPTDERLHLLRYSWRRLKRNRLKNIKANVVRR